jgi:hypothetical protein
MVSGWFLDGFWIQSAGRLLIYSRNLDFIGRTARTKAGSGH